MQESKHCHKICHPSKVAENLPNTVELRWLEPLWDHENLFETAVVRAMEGYYWCHTRRHNGDNCGISFWCSIFQMYVVCTH